MDKWFERVVRQAATVRPTKALLALVALPFYVVGLVVGLVLVVGLFAVSAARLGVADVRARAVPSREVT